MNKLFKTLAGLLAMCMVTTMGAGAVDTNNTTQPLAEYQAMIDELCNEYGVDLELVEQPTESVEELRNELLYFIQRSQAAEQENDSLNENTSDSGIMPIDIGRAGEVTNTYLKVRFNAVMDDAMQIFKGGYVSSVVGRSDKIAFNLSSSSFDVLSGGKSARIGIIGVLWLSGVQYNGYKDNFTVSKLNLF